MCPDTNYSRKHVSINIKLICKYEHVCIYGIKYGYIHVYIIPYIMYIWIYRVNEYFISQYIWKNISMHIFHYFSMYTHICVSMKVFICTPMYTYVCILVHVLSGIFMYTHVYMCVYVWRSWLVEVKTWTKVLKLNLAAKSESSFVFSEFSGYQDVKKNSVLWGIYILFRKWITEGKN